MTEVIHAVFKLNLKIQPNPTITINWVKWENYDV